MGTGLYFERLKLEKELRTINSELNKLQRKGSKNNSYIMQLTNRKRYIDDVLRKWRMN